MSGRSDFSRKINTLSPDARESLMKFLSVSRDTAESDHLMEHLQASLALAQMSRPRLDA